MKKYEEPTITLEVIGVEDVIATSTCPTYNDDCPWEG